LQGVNEKKKILFTSGDFKLLDLFKVGEVLYFSSHPCIGPRKFQCGDDVYILLKKWFICVCVYVGSRGWIKGSEGCGEANVLKNGHDLQHGAGVGEVCTRAQRLLFQARVFFVVEGTHNSLT
jgi:hypothetical protein